MVKIPLLVKNMAVNGLTVFVKCLTLAVIILNLNSENNKTLCGEGYECHDTRAHTKDPWKTRPGLIGGNAGNGGNHYISSILNILESIL